MFTLFSSLLFLFFILYCILSGRDLFLFCNFYNIFYPFLLVNFFFLMYYSPHKSQLPTLTFFSVWHTNFFSVPSLPINKLAFFPFLRFHWTRFISLIFLQFHFLPLTLHSLSLKPVLPQSKDKPRGKLIYKRSESSKASKGNDLTRSLIMTFSRARLKPFFSDALISRPNLKL